MKSTSLLMSGGGRRSARQRVTGMSIFSDLGLHSVRVLLEELIEVVVLLITLFIVSRSTRH